MAMEDLRGWLKRVEQAGLLNRIDGAHWDGEIGALSALNARKKAALPLLFDQIKDYPPGHRVLTCSISHPTTLAFAFNLPAASLDWELVDAFREKMSIWENSWQKFLPKVVKDGPILENVRSGKDIDLFEFPAPKWHEEDGGRYIGAGHAIITQDPDTGEVNLGAYRSMIHDKKTVGFHAAKGRHGRLHREKYHAKGKAAPVVVSIGHHPSILRAAALPFPPGSEYGMVGAVWGEPVRVIKEEVTGLPIPADGEIVLAGWCPPNKLRKEGPFGEFTGYYGSGHFQGSDAIIEVERVYFRHNPIILAAPPNPIFYDNAYSNVIMRNALLHNKLVQNGVPVKRVWLNEAVGGSALIIVSIKQEYAGHARRAALVASQLDVGAHLARYIVTVDEDIDPSNIDEVLWALCTRLEPEKDIQVLTRCPGSALDPTIRIDPGARTEQALFKSIAILDACKPYEWMDKFSKAIHISPELLARVKGKWGQALGL